MSPDLVSRAKRERWARQVHFSLVGFFHTIWFCLRDPRLAIYAVQLDVHAFLDISPPPIPNIPAFPIPKMKVRL